jgi:hypothetical protein
MHDKQKAQTFSMYMKVTISSFLIVFICYGCNNKDKPIRQVKDDYYEKCRKLVLSEDEIGQEYFFKINGKSIDDANISYLGTITTKSGKVLKFIKEINYSGAYENSKHGNGQVFIYDKENKKLGVYYVGGSSDVPFKIEGSNLIFSYNNERCDETTVISFQDSIPKQIFVACTKEGGDLYTFTKE